MSSRTRSALQEGTAGATDPGEDWRPGRGTAQQGRWHRTPVGSPSPLGSTRYGENNKITFFVYKVGDS